MTRIRLNVCKAFILLGILISFTQITYSQEENSCYGLFGSSQVLKIQLSFNIDSLLADRNGTSKDHPGTLTYLNKNGETTDIPIVVKTRGHFRKNPENCDFPPIRVKFLNNIKNDRLFLGLEWLKLVTHCQTDSVSFKQFVLQEYLLYKTYNLITPYSFNVRLLDIKYLNSSGSGDTIHSYGFFIERPKLMVQRNGGELVKNDNMFYQDMDEKSLVTLSLFQYMIWNNDWSVPLSHNVRFVKTSDADSPIPVPYDFDWAGIVSVPYRVKSMIEEENYKPDFFYKGICLKKKEFVPFFEFFLDIKKEIYSLYNDCAYLEKTQKERIINMYDSFYSLIKKPGRAYREFNESCFSK